MCQTCGRTWSMCGTAPLCLFLSVLLCQTLCNCWRSYSRPLMLANTRLLCGHSCRRCGRQCPHCQGVPLTYRLMGARMCHTLALHHATGPLPSYQPQIRYQMRSHCVPGLPMPGGLPRRRSRLGCAFALHWPPRPLADKALCAPWPCRRRADR